MTGRGRSEVREPEPSPVGLKPYEMLVIRVWHQGSAVTVIEAVWGLGTAAHVRHLPGLVVGTTEMTKGKEIETRSRPDVVRSLVTQRILGYVGENEHAQAIRGHHCRTFGRMGQKRHESPRPLHPPGPSESEGAWRRSTNVLPVPNRP